MFLLSDWGLNLTVDPNVCVVAVVFLPRLPSLLHSPFRKKGGLQK